MDHPSDLPAPQPWRSAAFIAVCVATVELLILLVVGTIFFGKFFTGQVDKATDPASVARAAAGEGSSSTDTKGHAREPMLPPRQTSVLVLNGNGVAGAAAQAAARARTHGYVVAGTGNAPRSDFARSVVMYRSGFKREAKRLSHKLGIRRVTPLDGMRKAELQGAHVAVVIGG
jgi:LytR cell envelope-related transcriptional attenuator